MIPPAVLLADCSATPGGYFRCADGAVELIAGQPMADEALVARIAGPGDAGTVELHRIAARGTPGLSATWTVGGELQRVQGWGPAALVERALLEWVLRGGVGGGEVDFGGVARTWPVGCLVVNDRDGVAVGVRCGDGGALLRDGGPIVAWHLAPERRVGELPCRIDGAPGTCTAAWSPSIGFSVAGVSNGHPMRCRLPYEYPEPNPTVLPAEACRGVLDWNEADLAAVVPADPRSTCTLGGDGSWSCLGVHVTRAPRACVGPRFLCDPLLTAFQRPLEPVHVDVFGVDVVVPAGCGHMDAPEPLQVARCEDTSGGTLTWMPVDAGREVGPMSPCTVRGVAAECSRNSYGAVVLVGGGMVHCEGALCSALELRP